MIIRQLDWRGASLPGERFGNVDGIDLEIPVVIRLVGDPVPIRGPAWILGEGLAGHSSFIAPIHVNHINRPVLQDSVRNPLSIR